MYVVVDVPMQEARVVPKSRTLRIEMDLSCLSHVDVE